MKRQISWFVFIGTIGFLVDAGLTQSGASLLGLPPIVARIPAIALAIFVTFLLNKRFTFKGTEKKFWLALCSYTLSQGAAQSVNFGVYTMMILLVPALKSFLFLAVAAGSISAMALSFLLYKFWVFKA